MFRFATIGLVAAVVLLAATTHEALAQNACYYYQPACGYGPGQFRPQGYTLNSRFIPERAAPGSYYAPIGPNGQYWRQFSVSRGYGPQEPNPYSNNGMLMNPYRIGNHVYHTRIVPRVQQYR